MATLQPRADRCRPNPSPPQRAFEVINSHLPSESHLPDARYVFTLMDTDGDQAVTIEEFNSFFRGAEGSLSPDGQLAPRETQGPPSGGALRARGRAHRTASWYSEY